MGSTYRKGYLNSKIILILLGCTVLLRAGTVGRGRCLIPKLLFKLGPQKEIHDGEFPIHDWCSAITGYFY